VKTALIQRDGTVRLAEAPAPEMLAKSARVRVRRSLISTGTETEVIRTRRAQPAADELRPGYSAVGEIVELSEDCRKGRVGQRAACAGWALATHSEEIVVPQNLFVPVPDAPGGAADDDNAAFIGCAVTCMHALRQGGVAGGDTVAVVGMGLFGQIVARIARAFGAVVCGVAKHPHQAEHAREVCRDVCAPRDLLEGVPAGMGPADVAIVAAGGDQSEMLRAAGRMLRDRGTVVILGRGWANVDFREEMFKKELTLKNTRAYGPGRYDPQYEIQGIGYPPGYVPWTETRNMAGVLDLMARGLLDLRPLITSRYALSDVAAAYEKLLTRPNREIAVVLDYGGSPGT